MTRLWRFFFFFFYLFLPNNQTRGGGEKWEESSVVFLPLQGHFIMFLIIQRGSLSEKPHEQERGCRDQVTLIILKLILPPSPPKIPALLWPSPVSKTHTISFSYCVCAVHGFVQFTGCMHVLCFFFFFFYNELPESHLLILFGALG